MQDQKNFDTPFSHPDESDIERITKYLLSFLEDNQQKMLKMQSQHIMLLYFIMQSLDVLNKLGAVQDNKQQIIDYIYSLQLKNGGFSCSLLYKMLDNGSQYALPHIVFTYSAINCLLILGDDLKRVDRKALVDSIVKCQKENGNFSSFRGSEEADLRFVYAAVATLHTLQQLKAINIDKVVDFILQCYNSDGGFGLRPGCESHSGAIYCAVSTMTLLNLANKLPTNNIVHFLASRQTSNLDCPKLVGVQGRLGKLPDSCYSFWVGSSICLLTGKNLLSPFISNFLDICLTSVGAYSKYPEMKMGDPVHTLHSIVGGKIIRDQYDELHLAKGIKKCRIIENSH